MYGIMSHRTCTNTEVAALIFFFFYLSWMICEHSDELVKSSFPMRESSLTKCCTVRVVGGRETIVNQQSG